MHLHILVNVHIFIELGLIMIQWHSTPEEGLCPQPQCTPALHTWCTLYISSIFRFQFYFWLLQYNSYMAQTTVSKIIRATLRGNKCHGYNTWKRRESSNFSLFALASDLNSPYRFNTCSLRSCISSAVSNIFTSFGVI